MTSTLQNLQKYLEKIKTSIRNPRQKIYKSLYSDNLRMFPSDPTGSLDDFVFLNKFLEVEDGRNIGIYR